MAFRTIIAFMRSQSEAPRIMAAANLLAKTTDNAHIIGLYTIPSPMVYADPTGFADATLFEAHEKHHKENSERISALFATEMKKSSISHEFRIIRSQHASPSSGVTHSALRADIIVAGQPDPEDPDTANDATDPLVMESGRPVMFVPYSFSPPEAMKNILVAFNGKREASRAAFDALPLLEQAESVEVIWVNPKESAAYDASIPGTPLADALRRHGVNIKATPLPSHGLSDEETIRQRVMGNDAQVLVMGAYSQSRLKEWVFGGVTTSIMHDMPCLTFMSR